MLAVRKSEERGKASYGWLNTYYSFSFANYYDPNHMGFRHLRVINEDRIDAGQGFPAHSHRDMEIITYVLEGALEHKDSIGNTEVISAGEVQVMSAGTGITHSEYNPSKTTQTHLLQIWILPNKRGVKPRYDQKKFDQAEKQGKLRLIISPNGRDESLMIHQDVNLYAGLLNPGEKVEYHLKGDRHAWLQVIQGEVLLNGVLLNAGDGSAVSETEMLILEGKKSAEILLFDLV
ncbi:MAG: pirin family protein [Halothece sp.]